MDKTKTIMITGASGFLGKEIINQIKNQVNYKIIALSSNKEKLLKEYKEYKNIVVYSLEDWEKGNIPFNKVDTLINPAFARSSDSEKLANSLDFTSSFINQAVDKGVGGIINISSQSVYSQMRRSPADEKSPIVPESLYAVAKYASEIIIRDICKAKGTPFTNLRLASLAGLGFDIRLTSRFVKTVIKGDPIKIIGGQQIISYMDVRDAAAGIIALNSIDKNQWKEIYNFGVNEYYTIIQIAEMVINIASKYIEKPVEIHIEEKDVVLNNSMNCSLFYSDVKWKPKYSMETIITDQFKN